MAKNVTVHYKDVRSFVSRNYIPYCKLINVIFPNNERIIMRGRYLAERRTIEYSSYSNSSSITYKVFLHLILHPQSSIDIITGASESNGIISVTIHNDKDRTKHMSFNSPSELKNYISSNLILVTLSTKVIIDKLSDKTKPVLPNNNIAEARQIIQNLQNSKRKVSTPQKNGLLISTNLASKLVTIKIAGHTFNSFEQAETFILNHFGKGSKTYKRLLVEKDKWDRQLWGDRIIRIIEGFYYPRIPFTEIFSKMNEYYKKDYTEEEAFHILDLCKDKVHLTKQQNGKSVEYYYSIQRKEERLAPKPLSRPVSEPQNEEVHESNVLFQNEFNRLINRNTYPKTKDVYVGLDFGTSYTKVAYHYTDNDRGIVRFGNTPFKPTVVYLDQQGRLSFFKKSESDKQIQFFKATMVKDSENYNGLRYSNIRFNSKEIKENFEMLCSVFFLANIIAYSKNRISEIMNFEANLFIAMGTPIYGSSKDTELYNKALHAGLYVASVISNPSTMTLEDIYSLYKESMSSFDNRLYSVDQFRIQHCTMPELFTEALYLIQRKNYPAGCYYIVDIGGGTSDFAFIQKVESKDEQEFDYYCPSAVVRKLGNEVRKACDSNEAKAEYLERFGRAFRTTIAKGKFGLGMTGDFTVNLLMFGGGSIDPSNYYQSKLLQFKYGLRSISCTISKRNHDIASDSFFSNENDLSEEDLQRLIIATQLANPNASDAYLKGVPCDFDVTPTVKGSQDITKNDPGYDPVG